MKIGMQLGYWGLAFAIVAALAACGGGDDGARPTPPAVDHEVTPLAITIDQPERGVLTFDALHAGDPDITFLGYQPRIHGLYRLSDVAIVPTRFEGESGRLAELEVRSRMTGRWMMASIRGPSTRPSRTLKLIR